MSRTSRSPTAQAPSLPALQRLVDTCLAGAGEAIEAPPMLAQLLALTRGDARADAAKRIGIYAYAYRARLIEALGNDYPALQAQLGEEAFELLGQGYIEAYPSSTPSLRWFGRHLAKYLREHELDQLLWAETAAFEWAQGEVFDAPDAPVVGLDAMASIPGEVWPQMRLLPQPSMRRLTLHWNVPARVAAHGRDEPLPEAVSERQPREWLLWRREDLAIHWRPLEAGEAAALDAARADASFSDICERLCEWVDPDTVAMHAAGILKRWINDELITAIEFPS